MSHTKEVTQAVKPTSTMFKGPVYLVAKEMFAMSRVSVRQQGSSVPSQCRRREDATKLVNITNEPTRGILQRLAKRPPSHYLAGRNNLAGHSAIQRSTHQTRKQKTENKATPSGRIRACGHSRTSTGQQRSTLKSLSHRLARTSKVKSQDWDMSFDGLGPALS